MGVYDDNKKIVFNAPNPEVGHYSYKMFRQQTPDGINIVGYGGLLCRINPNDTVTLLKSDVASLKEMQQLQDVFPCPIYLGSHMHAQREEQGYMHTARQHQLVATIGSIIGANGILDARPYTYNEYTKEGRKKFNAMKLNIVRHCSALENLETYKTCKVQNPNPQAFLTNMQRIDKLALTDADFVNASLISLTSEFGMWRIDKIMQANPTGSLKKAMVRWLMKRRGEWMELNGYVVPELRSQEIK